MRRIIVVLAALGVLALLYAPVAVGCSAKEGEHCYSLTYWDMNKSRGEELYGAKAEIESYYGYVPRWASGDRINNELWVAFENGKKWVEGGATIGNGLNATTPDYFVARDSGSSYWEFDYPGASPGYNTWYGLYLDEPHGATGEWCATWVWDSTPDFCWTGFWTASDEVETGMEFATTQQSGADNNGRSLGWALWTNWTWHELWQGSYTHAEPYWEEPLCINDPAPGYTWGSVAFSAPGC
jgi:hypothetical protein